VTDDRNKSSFNLEPVGDGRRRGPGPFAVIVMLVAGGLFLYVVVRGFIGWLK
jgi:hypothetical protein